MRIAVEKTKVTTQPAVPRATGEAKTSRPSFAKLGLSALDGLVSWLEENNRVKFRENEIFWGLRYLPAGEALKHSAILGTTGAGKSTLIQLYLQSIANRFKADRDRPEQLIVYDGKCDAIPLLAGLGFHPSDENVWILNPFDRRGVAWNIAEAVQTPGMARHLASLLIAEEPNSSAPFFFRGSRLLVYSAVLGLNAILGSRWTFRDLICSLDSKEHIEGVTAFHPRAKRIASAILNDSKHAPGVISHLATSLQDFEEVAALWHHCKQNRKFSVKEFLKRPGVLVLGYDPVLENSIWPINAIIMKALSDEILRQPDTRQPKHWFVLDEFSSMKRVECIHDLLNRGRSKGVSVLLGNLNLPGLVKIYEENGAENILSLCTYKCFLRAGDAKTAEWAERYFGKQRYWEESFSGSAGSNTNPPSQNTSSTVSYSIQERSPLMSSFFLDLPFMAAGSPFTLVNDIPCFQTTALTETFSDDVFDMCAPLDKEIPPVELTGMEGQTFPIWTEEEEEFFCGRPVQEKKPREADTRPNVCRRKKKKGQGDRWNERLGGNGANNGDSDP